MFNSETILIGHSLESDFKALKLIHDIVVDTSVLYPHKMGPPKKRALKTLCIENLKKIIQESGTFFCRNDHSALKFNVLFFIADHGHDSAEDSVVCIQLIKHYLRNRIIWFVAYSTRPVLKVFTPCTTYCYHHDLFIAHFLVVFTSCSMPCYGNGLYSFRLKLP